MEEWISHCISETTYNVPTFMKMLKFPNNFIILWSDVFGNKPFMIHRNNKTTLVCLFDNFSNFCIVELSYQIPPVNGLICKNSIEENSSFFGDISSCFFANNI